MIFDAHVHVVAPDEGAYPLSPRDLSGEWYREAPHSAEDLLRCMDAAGVAGAVLVQPVGAYSFDNRYTADAAAAHPERLAAVCCVDPHGDDPEGTLRAWVRERGMGGVRLFALSRESRSWLVEPPGLRLWACAAELGIQVVVTILPHQLPELREALERFPELPVSLDHAAFAEPDALLALAPFPHLHLKITTHVLDAATRADGDPARRVEQLARGFGAERLLWGSDFCQTHDRPYEALVDLARQAFRTLGEAERELCLGGVARRLFGG